MNFIPRSLVILIGGLGCAVSFAYQAPVEQAEPYSMFGQDVARQQYRDEQQTYDNQLDYVDDSFASSDMQVQRITSASEQRSIVPANPRAAAALKHSNGHNNDVAAADVNQLSVNSATRGDIQASHLTKLERLEQEIRNLRGQLEVQEHTIAQLQASQRRNYEDIDLRLNQLTGQQQQAIAEQPALAINNQQLKPKSHNPANEQQSYQHAYNYLRNKQYPQATNALQAYLKQYPQGTYSANAHYWLGELALINGEAQQAKQQFNTVISDFPKSSKVPDAMLKTGFIAADSGNVKEAKRILTKVKQQYPNSPSAQLAHQRLQQMAS